MEGGDKELNSQSPKRGTCLVRFKWKGMPAPAEEEERKNHYCKECGKSFSSGKALGGHFSSAHVQSKKDSSLNLGIRKGNNSLGSPAGKCCVMCGREFPSRKALFGHMRTHPERHWRGMDPPPAVAAEADEGSDDSSVLAPPPSLPVANVASSFKDWFGRAKRGRPEIRKPPSPEAVDPRSVKDTDMLHALEKLMKLVENHSEKQNDDVEDVGSSSLVADDNQSKKRKLDSAIDVAEEKLIEAETIAEAVSETEAETKAEAVSETKAEAEKIIQENSGTSTGRNFVCTTCNRSFQSHQALGGHKSSHNKFKISIINSIEEDQNRNNNKNNNVSRRRPGSYTCKICNTSFSSGQALGRHKRIHKEEEENKKNETVRVSFEIDLNKLPDEVRV